MFGKLIKSLRPEKKIERLPVVGDAAIGRGLRIDPSMLAALSAAMEETVSPDFIISAQGLVDLSDENGTAWLHRFYDDDDRMLQAMTDRPEGGAVSEWSFYVPAGAEYLAAGQTIEPWTERLEKAAFDFDGEAYARVWYDDDTRDQPAVRFVESVYEDMEMKEGREIPQECMIYRRDSEEGEVMLLAIVQGASDDGEPSLEMMLGTGLLPHQISI